MTYDYSHLMLKADPGLGLTSNKNKTKHKLYFDYNFILKYFINYEYFSFLFYFILSITNCTPFEYQVTDSKKSFNTLTVTELFRIPV